MRIRSRWWVLAVLSFLVSTSVAYGQRDPLAFASLGTLNVSSGIITINTDSLTLQSTGGNFTGVALSQAGGMQVAVFDFTNITIGSGIIFDIQGSRALAFLSRGNVSIASTLNMPKGAAFASLPAPGGYAGGAGGTSLLGTFSGSGPGGGGALSTGSSGVGFGGGFGGAGGSANSSTFVASGGATYGNLFTVLQGGSGGGQVDSGAAGGGGGAIEISAIGTVSATIITALGFPGGGVGGGGGAGGGILLSGSSISYTSLNANGGSSPASSSGINGTGGGGGRIALGTASYTLGTSVANTSVNGGNGSSSNFKAGYAGVITLDALTTTVPSGFNITLTGSPITSIAGSTTQTGATVEAYVRKDLVINSGGTVTLGVDNALRRLDSSGNNVTALTVNGTFNTGTYSQIVSTLSGSGTVNLNTGGLLAVGENNVDSFFAGATAGNGGLTKIGSGTLVFTGTAFSHTGPTTIQAGALQMAPASGTLTVSSSISGAGALQKYGSGTTVLTGTNTYSGNTLISSGTLRAGSNAAFSSSSAMLLNPLATLDVSSFNATIGSLTGSGTVTGSSGGSLTTGGDNTPTTFTGLVLGPIRLIKTGTGSLTFNGNSFGSKQLVVDGGILNLGSSMDTSNFESVRIGPDGTLNFNVNGVGLTSPVSGVGSSSKITINANNITLGSPIFFNGFNHQGELTVADFTLNLQSLGFAQLGSFTHINTGTINAMNGVALGSGSTLYGSGTVNGKVSAQLGSVIQAIGNLSLGSSSTPAGFISAGELRTRDNTVTLNSSSRATLGSLTTLGNGGSPGTVTATNGVLVDFGNSLVGYGTINTPNNLIQRSIINGTVEGNSGAQPITFTGWVKGVGTFNNVVFAGTWDPGFSPTLITAGSLGFSATNNLIMELGGLTRGSQFDGIDATGNVNLAGALSITRINGFNPNVGDAFVLINRIGGTGIFAGLNEGDSFHGTDGGTYVISYQGMNYITNMMAPGANAFSVVIAAVPEPTTWALIGLGVAGCSWASYRRFRGRKTLLDSEVILPG